VPSNTSHTENVPNPGHQLRDPVENPDSIASFVVAKGSNPSQIDQVFAKYMTASGAQRLGGRHELYGNHLRGWGYGLSEGLSVDITAKRRAADNDCAQDRGQQCVGVRRSQCVAVTVNGGRPFHAPLTRGISQARSSTRWWRSRPPTETIPPGLFTMRRATSDKASIRERLSHPRLWLSAASFSRDQ